MNRTHKHNARSFWIAIALLGCVAASLPATVRADDITDANVAAKVESAATVADHLAIANYYRKVAAENEEKAKLHERMRAQLSGEKASTSWRKHCTALVDSYRAAQKAAEAMVAEQEKLAASLGK